MRLRSAPLLLILLGLAACQAPPIEIEKPLAGYASGELGLMRMVSWPGGGSELSVTAHVPSNASTSGDLSASFSLEFADGIEHPFQVRPMVLPQGYTAILIRVPRASEDRVRLTAQLQAFVDGRDSEEALGLFLWRDEVVQLTGFTKERERLRRAIARLPDMASNSSALLDSKAINAVVADTLVVGGEGPSVMRAVVVVGQNIDVVPPTAIPIVQGLEGAADRIERLAVESIYQVAICGPTEASEVVLRSSALTGELRIPLSKTPPEDAASPCSLELMNEAVRPIPDTFDLFFSQAQRATYDSRVASLSTQDFDASLRFGPQGGTARVTAHLRGKGTLGCERSSYTIDIKGPGRHLFEASRTDEYYLLSMCADDRYVEQFTANQIMARMGLFPLSFRYVELLIDGETAGLYLLLEKAREELVRDQSRVRSVMRRRFDAPNDVFEVKYDEADSAPANSYQRITADLEAREDQFDVEQYLYFLALMSAFENGDFVDEIWVSGSETVSKNNKIDSYFSVMAWDNDDLFSECHYAGKYAFDDPQGLAYCAEAQVDASLLSDPQIYARFVDILEDILMVQLPPEGFDDAIETTTRAIMPFLERPGLSAAMVRLIADNPGAVDPTEAKRDIQEKLSGLSASYRLRRSLLLERIATYRDTL